LRGPRASWARLPARSEETEPQAVGVVADTSDWSAGAMSRSRGSTDLAPLYELRRTLSAEMGIIPSCRIGFTWFFPIRLGIIPSYRLLERLSISTQRSTYL
jgi:hypothetical protein